MKNYWLAACAAGMLAAAPAHALDIRVDPAPLYVFDHASDRNTYDVVLHNILIVNNERATRELRGLRVELRANGEIISTGRTPRAQIARRAERMASLAQGGVLRMMDFQFHLSRIMHDGERLSADATLEPGEGFLNTAFYVSSNGIPDTARVIVEGPRGDLGHVDIPVSRYQSPVAYRAPVNGRWYVAASGDAALHHRWAVSSEYALDLIRMNADLRSHSGDGARLEDYITYREPILAAADGVVVATRNDRRDNQAMLRRPGEDFDAYMERVAQMQQETLMQGGFAAAAGNLVLIRHANGEHSLYAHLHEGSVQVAVGETVTAGAQIAQAGSSGNSTEPHLHFQLIDGPDLNTARGLPITFDGLRPEWVAVADRHLRSGDVLESAR